MSVEFYCFVMILPFESYRILIIKEILPQVAFSLQYKNNACDTQHNFRALFLGESSAESKMLALAYC